MTLFAFLAPTAAPAKEVTADGLPIFKRHWWYSDHRLDARPVIWSLQNRPGDWVVTHRGRPDLCITHVPSKHKFWSCRIMGYRLDSADCSCASSRRRYQLFQGFAMGRAVRRWLRAYRDDKVDAEQFAAHFIPK